MHRRVRLFSGAVLATLFALTGCFQAPPHAPQALEPHDSVSLGDAVVATYLSPQWREFENGRSVGYVALANEQGDVRFIETSGMDNGNLAWNEQGLVFADVDNDYQLADTLRTIPSPKVGQQQSMAAHPDGTFTGLYNDGFTETGYVEQIVTTGQTGAALHEVEGYYQVVGNCDGQLFGVAEPLGKYATETEALYPDAQPGEYGFTMLMLAQLSGTADNAERVVKISQVDDSDQGAVDAPCRDGKLHHLATTYGASGANTPVLRTWDTATGNLTQYALVGAAGSPAIEVGEYGYYEFPTAHSLRGTQLDWLGLNGTVYTTALDTGVTTSLFSIETYELDPAIYMPSITFTERSLAVLTWDSERGKVHFAEYDRETGQPVHEVELPAVARVLLGNGQLVMRGIAVRPTG